MKTINQPIVGTTAVENSTVRYLNQYRCPYCQTEWEDVWDCGCNDRCPDCNKEIEPYESALIEGESVETELPDEKPASANVTAAAVNRFFVVSYEIDYVHRVSVGITADSPEALNNLPSRHSTMPAFGMTPRQCRYYPTNTLGRAMKAWPGNAWPLNNGRNRIIRFGN
ncbi:hypothetical protein [Methylomonas koyamae]|uniref:hypothetical protein n=1 Tax=Methylomonas koyamae TaxID=702114 RepID=UPI00210FDE2E|nr:hypothetical protein [Methylomonas koyamae]